MSLFTNPIERLFSSSRVRDDAVQEEPEKIIAYVEDLINREDLVADLVKKHEQAKTLTLEQRELVYIPIYFGFEAFIIRNKPLIIKQEFTKDELRAAIRKQFDINKLGASFRLLFLLDGQQNALLFEQGAQKLAKYVTDNIGLSHLKTAVASLKSGKIKESIHVTDQGLSFDAIDNSSANISEKDITLSFQELNQALLTEITKSVGPNVGEKVISEIYDEVKRTYDYDIISKFLDVLPDGILENERIRQLGRDELEGKIQSRTRELVEARKQVELKLELIRKQNDELAKAKQALTVSLQEEKRLEEEIKKEKEQVEEKVKERTEELNNAMTSLKVSYQQTENEKARLLASINNLSLGFVMTDSNDNIIAINHISSQILKSQDKKFDTIQQLHEYLQESANLNEYYQKCKSEKVVQKMADINFANTFLRFFFTPIIINDNCIGVVILLEDISEAKLLERSKDEFFAVASHELRTPLTAIRGYTSLILDNFHEQIKGEPIMVNMINNIHASSIRLIKIVNNFLDASKLEQGKFILNVQSFALIPIIDDVVADLTTLANEKNIYLKFENEGVSLPNASADPEKIKQVLYNLVGNAIKFTEKGGITVSVANSDSQIRVTVKDTGLGVSDEYQKLLFRKFQQAGERILTRDAATGSGMGLYISKLLLEAMKGSISIEKSKLGEGSIFVFAIPIAK